MGEVNAATRLWLIRHGEPVADRPQLCCVARDTGLSETGRRQISNVAEYLKAQPIFAIYASPLARALESARMLGCVRRCPVAVVPDLREIDFGDFEGLTFDEIAARDPDLYRRWMETPTEVRFPNGEEFAETRARVLRAAEAIRRECEGQAAMVVSHGGVNRILIAEALQLPDQCLFRVAQDHAAINLVSFVEGSPSVQLVNHCVA